MRALGAIAFLAACAASPAFALAPETPITAERAVETQKDGVREVVGTLPAAATGWTATSSSAAGADRIPTGSPSPTSACPASPENLLPGELPRARTSYNTCMIACPQPVTITDKDVRKYGGRILRHILGKDD